jgi:hypothetical protein
MIKRVRKSLFSSIQRWELTREPARTLLVVCKATKLTFSIRIAKDSVEYS